jgi:hypothetical protein
LAWAGAVLGAAFAVAPSARAQALFQAGELDQNRFVLVAAPIGKGERSQLNIYEQILPSRACFAIGEGRPAPVNPLLTTFDFTGICGRYIDANGYSLRVGGTDLATTYRLMVSRSGNDTLLLAVPTRGSGPEMVVARSGGIASGFLKLEMEPGWRLMRRQFGGRALGHVYLYNDGVPAPGGSSATSALPAPALPSPARRSPVPAPAAPAPAVAPGAAPAAPAAAPATPPRGRASMR